MKLAIAVEAWPIAGIFTIARGSKTQAEVVVVTLTSKGVSGHGECVPYRRYGETIESVCAQIEAARGAIEAGIDTTGLIDAMPAGAARNAVDAALIDLACKLSGVRAWELLGLTAPQPKPTCFTISLDSPDAMADAARAAFGRPILKLKLGRDREDVARTRAVRRAVPDVRLVVDANEGWTIDDLALMAPDLAQLGVEMIEQPLPADQDEALGTYKSPVPLCADESAHGIDTLALIATRYQAINLKLDKTGGLTSALRVAKAAQALGLSIMLGCMVGTSLSMAPATILLDFASIVDLDGPLLLARDRNPGLDYENALVLAPGATLWG